MNRDHLERSGQRVDGLALWIFLSCWCTLTGWVLSVAGCLNAQGYAASLVPFAALLIFFRSWFWRRAKSASFWSRIVHNRRWPPKLWFALTVLAFAGGLLYHPANYDYLTYRFPRVLNWCWEQKWHWIATFFAARMNLCATGFEWMMTPIFVFFKTDRLFFLLNYLPYLFLPGLVFSVFRDLGISPRFCWWWMWVLPSGYCFILQAASAGNDTVAAIYLLASFHYLFAAKKSSDAKNPVLSCLALALATGVKASNLPLILPWLIAVGLNRRTFFIPARPVIIVGMVLFGSAVSFLPMAILNIHFTGDYSGDPYNFSKLKLTHPVSGIIGNGLQLATDNLAPPLWFKAVSLEKALPSPVLEQLRHDYPRIKIEFGEMQTEEAAGVGLGVSVFAATILTFGCRAGITRPGRLIRRQGHAVWIVTGAVAALVVYMAKMGSESTARLLAAYYPLLLAGISVLASPDGLIVKRTFFKTVGVLSILSALPLVIVCPSRPLFPTTLVSHELKRWGVSALARARFDQVYAVYATRFDDFHNFRILIPDTERAVGIVHVGDDPSVSLWLPFGSRQVIDLTPGKSRDDLDALGIHYVIVNETYLEASDRMTLDELMARWSADVVTKTNLVIKIHRGSESWCLIHCR